MDFVIPLLISVSIFILIICCQIIFFKIKDYLLSYFTYNKALKEAKSLIGKEVMIYDGVIGQINGYQIFNKHIIYNVLIIHNSKTAFLNRNEFELYVNKTVELL